jgi:hypothetical protein
MSGIGFFFDAGNVGVTFGETIFYTHWTELAVFAAVPAALALVWFFGLKGKRDSRP